VRPSVGRPWCVPPKIQPGTVSQFLPEWSENDAVDPLCVVAEELPPLLGWPVSGDRLESRKDRVEGSDQAVHRVVAGEHRTLDAENGDRLAHDRRILLDAPGSAGEAQTRDLERNVGLRRDERERGAPGGDTGLAAVGRQPDVVDDDLRCREV